MHSNYNYLGVPTYLDHSGLSNPRPCHIVVPFLPRSHFPCIYSHSEQLLPDATTIPPLIGFGPHIVPQKYYGFGDNQIQPCYVFGANQTKLIGFGHHIIPQRHYDFGANKTKLYYGFCYSYSDVYNHPPPIDFNTKLLETLREAG